MCLKFGFVVFYKKGVLKNFAKLRTLITSCHEKLSIH